MPSDSTKADVILFGENPKITGFTLDADGVIKPAEGLEAEFSRLFFKDPLRYNLITLAQSSRYKFKVLLRFEVSKGLFEGQICAGQHHEELIHSEVFQTCRSLEEARHAFDLFFEKTKNEIRSVRNCAKKCQDTSGSVIEL